MKNYFVGLNIYIFSGNRQIFHRQKKIYIYIIWMLMINNYDIDDSNYFDFDGLIL